MFLLVLMICPSIIYSILFHYNYVTQWPQFSVFTCQRSYNARRMVTPEDNPFLESDTSIGIARIRSDVSGSRHHRHVRHGFREGLAEVSFILSLCRATFPPFQIFMMFQLILLSIFLNLFVDQSSDKELSLEISLALLHKFSL